MKRKNEIKRITYTAMFMAIAIVLTYFETALPFIPTFLKLDIGGFAMILSSLLLGWIPGILVNLVVQIVHGISSSSGGVGQVANFIIISSYILVCFFINKLVKNKFKLTFSLTISTLAASIVGVLANKYILIPAYAKTMPIDAIIDLANGANPAVNSLETYLIFAALPFNLVKFTLLSILVALIYTRLSKMQEFMMFSPSKEHASVKM